MTRRAKVVVVVVVVVIVIVVVVVVVVVVDALQERPAGGNGRVVDGQNLHRNIHRFETEGTLIQALAGG